ncbi:MAG: DUF2849 domain-containing protein [Alphaproteobacteria bacterium]
MTSQVITANRLQDGRVVYLTAAGQWSPAIAEARLYEDETGTRSATAKGAASVAARQIVDPYLIPVVQGDGGITPTRYREVIRAFGPSITAGISGQEV